MEWEIIIACLAAIVGLFMTVGKPIIVLNQTITKLNVTLQGIERRVDDHDKKLEKQAAHARESHQRIWDHNREQDDKIQDHETRIYHLEHKEE